MKTMTLVMLGTLVAGCAAKDDEAGLPPMSFTDADADADADADSDADADADADADVDDDCADYRTEYPSGPYGFTVGSVMADPPGMVDGSGAAQSLVDVFGDRTKMALVIANAFDT